MFTLALAGLAGRYGTFASIALDETLVSAPLGRDTFASDDLEDDALASLGVIVLEDLEGMFGPRERSGSGVARGPLDDRSSVGVLKSTTELPSRGGLAFVFIAELEFPLLAVGCDWVTTAALLFE